MISKMSSRERYLTTCRHEEPDRVPIDLQPCGLFRLPGVSRRLPLDQQMQAVRDYGGDPLVDIWMPPETAHPDVKVRKGSCGQDENGCSLIFAEWETPAGTLRSVVRQTADWFDVEDHALLENVELGHNCRTDWDVHLFNNYNCMRFIEAPIKTIADVKALDYLLKIPTGDAWEKWHSQAIYCKKLADEHDLLLRARCTFAAGGGIWLMKPEDWLMATATEPELVHAMNEAIEQWQLKRLEAVLDIGVDAVLHASYYETVDYFGGPRWYDYCQPFIERLAQTCHEADTQLTMQRSEKNTAQIEVLKKLPIDHIHGLEPGPAGQENMSLLKSEIGDRITLWGGVDTTCLVTNGTVEEIDDAVKEAIEICAPSGGFVILAAAWAMDDAPDENIKAVINAAIRHMAITPIKDAVKLEEAKSTAIDVIIIGAGHNGLVCAGYLAKAGLRVLVERSSAVRGGCVIQELVPGCHFSKFAYGVHGPSANTCRDLEKSLKHVQTEYVDSYLAHISDPKTPPEDIAPTFDEIIRSGKARAWGFSIFEVSDILTMIETVEAGGCVLGPEALAQLDAGLRGDEENCP